MQDICYPLRSLDVTYVPFEGSIPRADALIIAVSASDIAKDTWGTTLSYIDKNTAGTLRSIVEKRAYCAKPGSHIHIGSTDALPVQDIIIIGVGDQEPVASSILHAFAMGVSVALSHKATDILIWSAQGAKGTDLHRYGSLAAQAAILAGYRFDRYKKNKEDDSIPSRVRVVGENNESVHVKHGIQEGLRIAHAAVVARDLVNEPPSVTTPTYLASVAKTIAGHASDCTVKVLDEKAIEAQGFGGIMAVSRGSDEVPRFIILERGNRKKRPVVLVGKGVTFDSGGLSLKSSGHMESMKIDMAGAASVLGVFHALSTHPSDTHVIGLIPAVENMPSGKAVKPGDVIRMYDQTSVEILNTDAEGRLILADAIAYAIDTFKPASIIDVATLTGACVVALGEDITGVFSNDDMLADAIGQSADRVGEDVWRMPLFKGYVPQMKSPVADLKNISSSRYGGAITAALFLSEFVGAVPWAHLDVAGPAWQEKGTALHPKGGSGIIVRTLIDFILTRDDVVSS